LANEGLEDPDEPETALVRRVIAREGRSRCWVNGKPVAVATLRQLGDCLVDLHGQHQHQSLLDPERHREVLDDFGGHVAAREFVAESHAAWAEIRARRRALEGDARELERRREFLLHQIREIDATRLQPGELDELTAERGRLRHAEALLRAAALGVERLQESDEGNALALIAEVRGALEAVAEHDASLAALLPRLDDVSATLADVANELQSYGSGIERDPERLESVDDRITAIRKLLKRYGETVEDVLAQADAWRQEAESIENRDAECAKLAEQEKRHAEALAKAALALRAERERASVKLGKALAKELRDVGMERVVFDVRLDVAPDDGGIAVPGHGRVRIDAGGMESVEFLISANVGEPARPLAKIASGGELSRIMLALKAVAAGRDRVPTLVFDEIDVGISGETAIRVGEKMARLATRHQILCITHLPQIAARAAVHLGVSKRARGKRTVTEVTRLEGDVRVEALARLIGGNAGETARRHADEMLSLGTAK
jgi:DNA repair protein RecN (Recombination protein N)